MFLGFVIFLIIFGFLVLLTGAFKKASLVDDDGELKPKGAVKAIAVLVLALVIGVFQPVELERIDVGHVGMKVNNTGDERGLSHTVYVTGWVFYNSWLSRIIEYPVTQQHVDYEPERIITKGGFEATIKPSFNWSVNPSNAAEMYQNLRQDVEEIQNKWLKNAIVGAVNDVANLYTVDSIFNHRAEFEAEIVREANKRVSKWFTVSQLRTNIVPPEAITQAINAKTKAVQEAQAAIQERIVAENQAQTKIAIARGDSAQAVITAAGDAEAIKLKTREISPTYVEYIRWVNAGENVPRVPSAVLGNGASTLFNLK